MRNILTSALFCFSLIQVNAVQSATIDFSSAPKSLQPNGYTIGDVSFATTYAGKWNYYQILLGDWSDSSISHGMALAIVGEEAKLEMSFSKTSDFLSLEFGNDNPQWISAGSKAWLAIYMDNTLVNTTSVVMNLNTIMDQSISLSGMLFNRALFWYGDTDGHDVWMSEVVDNITYTTYTPPVPAPAPAAVWLFGSGLAGLLGFNRRKTSTQKLTA